MADTPTRVAGLTFEEWKAEVNGHVLRIAGVTCDDIGDAEYWSSWNAGVTPKEMAVEALAESDFPFGGGHDA
jgi:hypothetical protein